MKKLLSLLIALLMLFSFTGVLAENESAETEMEPITIEITFEGTEVLFEDGFSVMVPDEWWELEAEDGVAYGTEDGENYMVIQFVEDDCTFEDLQQTIIDLYGSAMHVSLNDIDWVTFTDTEYDELVAAAMGVDGYYFFTFYPASDAELEDLATQIMATIKNT